jgi:succinate dehydrogenase / fumarate reductase membrane anchor subunit
VTFVALFYHAWVGMREIFMDYVKPAGWRLGLEVITIVCLTGCAGWAAQIIWSV